MQLSKFLSDIGGTLGLWLGMSILSIVEFIEFFVDLGVFAGIKVHDRCNKQNKINAINSGMNQINKGNATIGRPKPSSTTPSHAISHPSASVAFEPPLYTPNRHESNLKNMNISIIDNNKKHTLPSPIIQKTNAWQSSCSKSISNWQSLKTNQRNIAWQQEMARQPPATPREIDMEMNNCRSNSSAVSNLYERQNFDPFSPPPPYSSYYA